MIRPFYEEPGITIYHGDCREVLQEQNFDHVDVILTDPPYGIGMEDFLDDFWVGVEGLRLAPGKRAAVFHSPRRIFDFIQAVKSWRFERLLWMHKSADLAAPWRGWCMNSEVIAILSRSYQDWPHPTHYRTDLYSVGPWERAGHPNGKPLSVVSDLLTRLSVTGMTILDPFMGSGTTLRAAKDLSRQAIGIEIEERYCEITANRLRQAVLPLSDGPEPSEPEPLGLAFESPHAHSAA